MESNLITIKEVALKNNCPECYTKEGLQLSFKQKLTDTKSFYSCRFTNSWSYSLFCVSRSIRIRMIR